MTAAIVRCDGAGALFRGSLDTVGRVPGNRLESLEGHREGQYSIRINVQYRVCFRWEGGDAYEVEVTDYHE